MKHPQHVDEDVRGKVWCRDHGTWTEKCAKVHVEWEERLNKMRELFKDVE